MIAGYFAAYKSIVGENGEKLPAHWQFAMDERVLIRGSNALLTGNNCKLPGTPVDPVS